ncbi:MAG: glycosyltransferase [Planctomycetota bacterium]
MTATAAYFIALLVAAGVAAMLVLPTRRLAWAWNLIDNPDARKVHAMPMPRVGGIAFFVAVAVAAVPVLLLLREDVFHDMVSVGRGWTFLLASVAIFALGLADDAFNIPGKYKLLVLLAASATLCGAGIRVDEIVWRDGTQVIQLGWAAWPLTMLWIVTVVVAVNFIDGLDGLAAGISLIVFGVIAAMSISDGSVMVAVISLAWCGALLGFLPFNIHPAKTFMGDCGSMSLGFGISALAVLHASPPNAAEGAARIGTLHALIVPAIALSVPLMDTALTMIRRPILHRRSIFAAEQEHIHHRLLHVGLTHRYAVFLIWGVTATAAIVALVAGFGNGWATLGGLSLLIPLMVGLFRLAGSVRARETFRALRRNRAAKRDSSYWTKKYEDAQLKLGKARTFEQWWVQLIAAAEMLDVRRMTLSGLHRDGEPFAQRWDRPGHAESNENPTVAPLTAEFPVRQRRLGEQMRLSIVIPADKLDGSNIESAAHRLSLMSRLLSDYSLHALNRFEKAATEFSNTSEDAPSEADLMSSEEAPTDQPRVAIVHDFLYTYAGAERVLEQMLEVFPHADLFSLIDFVPAEKRQFIRNKPVKTSFIQRLPLAKSKHRAYLPLMPLAIEQLNVSDYDVVLSSSYLAAKGVITRPDQLHISYCHSPPRWAWDLQNQYLSESKLHRSGPIATPKLFMARALLHYIRNWDVRSATGVDEFLSNSAYVGRRIFKTYRRKSTVLFPPVDTTFFSPGDEAQYGERGDFYVTASRFVPYKRIDLVVEAFKQMPDKRLVVIGDGPDRAKIQRIAEEADNIKLVGRVDGKQMLHYFRLAKAFVFAAEEDFGIVPVEAMACGTPVIAYGRGGVRESVVEGETGVFFDEQTPQAIADAVHAFEDNATIDHAVVRARAEQFSEANFREQLRAIVEGTWFYFCEHHGLPHRVLRNGSSVERVADASIHGSHDDEAPDYSRNGHVDPEKPEAGLKLPGDPD